MKRIRYALRYGKSGKVLARVLPDEKYPAMWRIHWPDGEVSDMVNLTRARDAARALVRKKYPRLPHDDLLTWDTGQSAAEAGASDFQRRQVPQQP